MNAKLRKWMPIALCCLPGVAVAAIVGIGVAAGGAAFGTWLGGPLGLGLIALAMLACPISMGLTMRRQRGATQQQNSAPGASQAVPMASCCLPGEETSADQLVALRARREVLEREVAEMQAR
ncbi:MAG: hypothetical protein ACRDH2_12910 [Anaerolineales bacterium]